MGEKGSQKILQKHAATGEKGSQIFLQKHGSNGGEGKLKISPKTCNNGEKERRGGRKVVHVIHQPVHNYNFTFAMPHSSDTTAQI